jgi:hypothetical protein
MSRQTEHYSVENLKGSYQSRIEIGTITFIGPIEYSGTVVMEAHIGGKKVLFWPPRCPREWYWPDGKKGVSFVCSNTVLFGRPVNLVLRGELAPGAPGRFAGFRPRDLLVSEYCGSFPFAGKRSAPGIPTLEHEALLAYTRREPQQVDIGAIFQRELNKLAKAGMG